MPPRRKAQKRRVRENDTEDLPDDFNGFDKDGLEARSEDEDDDGEDLKDFIVDEPDIPDAVITSPVLASSSASRSIDPSLIIEGKRTRKPVKRYIDEIQDEIAQLYAKDDDDAEDEDEDAEEAEEDAEEEAEEEEEDEEDAEEDTEDDDWQPEEKEDAEEDGDETESDAEAEAEAALKTSEAAAEKPETEAAAPLENQVGGNGGAAVVEASSSQVQPIGFESSPASL